MKNCRHCNKALKHSFLDLGSAPPSNALLSQEQLFKPEIYYPLKVMVCEDCWLVQTEDFANAEDLFQDDYPYFSSTSSTWLAHASEFSSEIIQKLRLDSDSLVIEIASNDGYLLSNFVELGIPCLGIEPTNSTADVAERLGIPVLREFFSEELGQQLAKEGKKADLIVGNNIYAHVPDINNFTKGLKAALKQNGTITLEFPHLMRLIEHGQFDTIYHEHFSYLSLYTVSRLFTAAGLRVWHVEELPTHGGSLRVYGCHNEDPRSPTEALQSLLEEETLRGIKNLNLYADFQRRAEKIKNDFLMFLIETNQSGKSIAAYGAAAKGNTLLNYAGVKSDLLPFISDASTAKQCKYMPGSHIPILNPQAIIDSKPNYILILPWNIADEVKSQLFQDLPNTHFVTAVPEIKII